MADVKPREVPAKQAEKFLEGVEDDPKFQRFQRRMTLSTQATQLSQERTEITRFQTKAADLLKTTNKRLSFVFYSSVVLLAVDALLRLWLVFAGGLVVACVVCTLLYRMLVKTRLLVEGLDSKADELNESILTVHDSIQEIDREAASSIRIIDPDTFGAPPAPIKPRAEEA